VKILHLTGEKEDLGGIPTVIRNLQSATASLGWKHAVWVNQSFQSTRQPPLDCRHSRHIEDGPSAIRMAIKSVRAYGELRQLLKSEPFDILHAHSRSTLIVALGVAKLSNRPVVFTNHNYASRLNLYRWAAKQKNVFTILLTPNMAKYYSVEIQPPKITVISSCCADNLFEQPLITQKRDPNDQTLRLAGVGSLFRWKRWELVARALMQLAETERNRVEFSLWGPTPDNSDSRRYESELRETIKRLRLERQFTLRGSMKSLKDAFHQVDWMVHPATNEPCGVALIEAMAHGIPAVVSNSGGPADIVEAGRTGLLFEPNDPRTLADHLRRILRKQVTLAAPSEIRQSVRHRSASAVANDYAKLYEHVLKSKS
jgi:glycosyltransferase involved in cell wall biosynthesis